MKYDFGEIEKLCIPIVEYLKQHNPYTSVVVTTDLIKLQETQVSIPINNE